MVSGKARASAGQGSRDWRPFVFGGLASITAEFGTFPIDTTKTRLQIQGQTSDVLHSATRYRGMIDCFIKISREEGIKSLYSGISPAVLRQATYGTIKFGTYYTLKKWANDYGFLLDQSTGEERVSVNILCAVAAGAVSSAIANPTDVLKVRMQVNGSNGNGRLKLGGTGAAIAPSQQNKNLFRAFQEIYRYEGVRGLWRGVGPTAQRAVVIAAVELPVYDFCKNHLLDTFGDRVSNHFISSFIASLGSAVASTPLDVIRTRLMNQKRVLVASMNGCATATTPPAAAAKIYEGTIHCAMQTIRTEGVMALYKGFIPAWLRMGPWNIIFFITYEQLKNLY